jgi:hypothetical protein
VLTLALAHDDDSPCAAESGDAKMGLRIGGIFIILGPSARLSQPLASPLVRTSICARTSRVLTVSSLPVLDDPAVTSACGVLFPILGKRYARMPKHVFDFAKCVRPRRRQCLLLSGLQLPSWLARRSKTQRLWLTPRPPTRLQILWQRCPDCDGLHPPADAGGRVARVGMPFGRLGRLPLGQRNWYVAFSSCRILLKTAALDADMSELPGQHSHGLAAGRLPR